MTDFPFRDHIGMLVDFTFKEPRYGLSPDSFTLFEGYDKERFSTRNSARHSELVTHSGGTLFNFLSEKFSDKKLIIERPEFN